MTTGDLIINNPIKVGEANADYIKRLISICPDKNYESVRKAVYRYKRKAFVTVEKKYVKGQLVGHVEKLRAQGVLDIDLPIVGVSTHTGTGSQWIMQRKSDSSSLDIESMVLNALDVINRTPIKIKASKTFESKALFNIITDVHAGMDVSEGFLDYDWNSKLLIKAFSDNFSKLIYLYNLHGKMDKIYIMDLGDSLDGYEGRTTRGGHELPQNMTTEEQFSLVLNTYISYIEELLKADLANEIIIYRVENDNHAGTFGKLLNIVLSGTIKKLYPKANITFTSQSDFIGRLYYGEHVILPTHGKDIKFMKQNLPLLLNKRWVDYLNSIIKRWGLLGKSISIFKGDLHQLGLSSQTLFKYYNFPAFSPPSGWCQHNFGAPNDIGYSMHLYGKSAKDKLILDETFDF